MSGAQLGARNCAVWRRYLSRDSNQVPMMRPEKGAFDDPHERPIVTEDNKTAVRAGSTGNNVRYVLIGSVALGNCRLDSRRILRQAVNALGQNRPSDRLDNLRREAASCRLAPCGKTRPRPYLEKGRRTQRSCSSASSPETRKTARVVHLSGRRVSSSTGRSQRQAWTVSASTSPTRSSISNSSRAASGRLHKRPNASEIKICRRWLVGEIQAMRPAAHRRPWGDRGAGARGTSDPGSEQSRQDPRGGERTAHLHHHSSVGAAALAG